MINFTPGFAALYIILPAALALPFLFRYLGWIRWDLWEFFSALTTTIAGVYIGLFAESKRQENQNRKNYLSQLQYIFVEVLHNYKIIIDLCDQLKNDLPSDHAEAFRFLNVFVSRLRDQIFLSFLGSEASVTYSNDRINSAVQNLYKKVWDVRTGFELSANVFTGREEKEPRLNEIAGSLFESTRTFSLLAKKQFEDYIPVLVSEMKKLKRDTTYTLVRGDNHKLEIFDSNTTVQHIEDFLRAN